MKDLEEKIGNITVAYTRDKKPIYAKDLNAQGPMTMLLKDAIRPNVTQTLENNPAIIHMDHLQILHMVVTPLLLQKLD